MTFEELKEDVKEACRACIDVKSWFKETKMKTSAAISKEIIYADPVIEDPINHRLSSNGIVCPPDSRELGRNTWTFLHTTAAYLPEKPSEEQKGNMASLLQAVSKLYPCRQCGEHMEAYIDVNPIKLDTKKSISRWLCDFHNEVNQMLGKEIFDCSKIDERWKSGPSDDSCDK